MKTALYFSGLRVRRSGLPSLMILIFALLLCWPPQQANAQRGGGSYKGLTNRNGMLVFNSKESFKSIYQQLEAAIDAQDRDPNAKSGPVLLGDCEDDNAVLANFESQMGISSLRRMYLVRECEDLSKGLAPEQLISNPVPDEILAAFLNEKGEMQVGNVIYLMKTVESYLLITDGNLRTLRALQRGENPGKFDNVEVHDNLPIEADFDFNYLDENTVQFLYTGDPLPRGSRFFWNFGDGTTSTEESPVHTFSSEAKRYQVRLVVTLGGTTQRDGKGGLIRLLISVGKWTWQYLKCAPLFKASETGNPGEICFQFTPLFNHPVVSYHWDFGDGATSTAQNPCHTYTCDKTYLPKLTVVYSDSCGTKSFTRWVNVNSYACCANNAKVHSVKYYQAGNRKIVYKQGQYYVVGLFTKIYTKMKNYKKGGIFGDWSHKKAKLALDRDGDDFTKSAEGCKCQMPYDISDYKVVYNKWKIVMNKTLWFTQAKIAETAPWKVRYLVDDNLILDKTTPMTCD